MVTDKVLSLIDLEISCDDSGKLEFKFTERKTNCSNILIKKAPTKNLHSRQSKTDY